MRRSLPPSIALAGLAVFAACTSPKVAGNTPDARTDSDAPGLPTDVTQAQVLPPPTTGDFALPSGDAWLTWSAGSPSPRLAWHDKTQVRAVLDVDKLQFGRVPAFDPERNYDPAVLEADPLDGLQWLHVEQWSYESHVVPQRSSRFAPAQGVTVRLKLVDDQGQPGPDYLLEIDASDLGRFRLDLHLADPVDRELAAHDQMPKPVVYLRVVAALPEDQGFYGLGEFADTPEHRGRIRDLQLEPDLNLDGSSNEGHVRVPLLVGTRGWGLFLESRRPMRMDVAATHADRVETVVQDSQVRFWLLAADKPIDIPGLYTRLTGAPALPAPWAFGGMIWRNENKDQAEVLDDLATIRKQDLALSAMWLDRPFDVAVNDFGFDPQKFPDPKTMVDAVHALGFRMGEWSTPYLDPGPKNPKALHHDEAASQGFFVQTPVGPGESKLQQWGPPIDFTAPGATAFWKSLVRKAVDAGIEGWKLDYGEDIQLGLLGARLHYPFADGSDERTMHHGYMPLYHQPYAETLPDSGGFLLCRAGTYGDQVYTSIVWPGDLCANWTRHGDCDDHGCHAGGLPAAVSEAISLPTSGFPLFGSDTGGYKHGRASKELFLRWLGHTALSGILQIGGGNQHNPWDFAKYDGNPYGVSQFDQETLDAARELIRLHARLFPYLYHDAKQAHEHQGIGPVRALAMMHPDLALDPGLQAHEADEYYLGEFLLVAPVITPGGKREVWLPPGEWRDWWTHQVVGLPGQATVLQVEAPLGHPPLYVKTGAMIPRLRPTIDTLAPSTQPGVESWANGPGRLHWLYVPGAPGTQVQLWTGQAAECATTPVGLMCHAGGDDLDIWLPTTPKSVQVEGKDLPRVEPASACENAANCWAYAGGVLHVVVPAASASIQVTP